MDAGGRPAIEAMNCSAPLADELLEDYLHDRLDETARRRVEEHYFACASCLARIETLQALRPALLRDTERRSPGLGKRLGVAVAAAAAVIAAALVVQQVRGRHETERESQTARVTAPVAAAPRMDGRERERLAQLTAPAYRRPALRNSTAAVPGFDAAMDAYGRGDYLGAAQRLSPLATAHAERPEVLFFLGVSQLLSGRVADGVARLEQTVALGDTPYLEQATFCLAKARLAAGDVAKAEEALEAVIRLRGDLEGPARELQRRVRALGGQAPPARVTPGPRS